MAPSTTHTAFAALGYALLLLNQAFHASACTCLAQYITPCEYAQGIFTTTTVVFRGTALSKSAQTDINEDVTFTVQVNAVYSGDVDGQDEISFVTGGNSAICGVDLTIGEEYLLGLYPAGDDPFDSTGGGTAGQLTVGLCDLARVWSDVPDDEKADLEAGCGECDVSCGEFQECLLYEDGLESEYYCADTCDDPDRCADNETCVLTEVACIRAPCPPVASCEATENCDGACDDTQECLQYARNGKYYCSDTCDSPAACEEGEECSTRPRKWCRSSGYDGCPEKRRCR
ncbi:conserved unknown protein [Ectocarpus siliculosus]|uniref:Uncharacterized protein n=1 Tax=Ectocarpus siliculosus TaxID=2880 RepID=D8LCN7_ECTSI|nr:conserved unknown protein [Ectocarpus siliculosus]|eukprot:CBN79550.1 conserved unknown protein [Ectocarpus siliculosus]